MAVYKIKIRTCPNELLVSAADIDCAMEMVMDAYKCSWTAIQRIEVCEDARTVLDACWESAEDKLEALLNVLPPCLAFHQKLMRDIAVSIVYDATGVAGMVAELKSKEVH